MSVREPPEAQRQNVPRFPRPRAKEASPYRERIAPAPGTPPAERTRRIVTRPEPPLEPRPARRFSGNLGLPNLGLPTHPAPEPAGVLSEIRRALNPLTTFAGNHPHIILTVLVALVCLHLACCGRKKLAGPFVL